MLIFCHCCRLRLCCLKLCCLYYILFFSPPTFSFLRAFAYPSPFSRDDVFLKVSVSVSLAVPLAKLIGALIERLPLRWTRAPGSRLGTWPSLAQIGFSVRSRTDPARSLSWLTSFSFPSLPNIVSTGTLFHLLPDGHFSHVYQYPLIKHMLQLHLLCLSYRNKHAFICHVHSCSSGSLEGLWFQTSFPSVVFVLFLIFHCFTLQMNSAITSGANGHLTYTWNPVERFNQAQCRIHHMRRLAS